MPDYAPGVPMWVDVSSPDIEASKTFYGGLFGWDGQTVPDPEAGGYTMFMLNGKMVAAAGPTFGPEVHPAWATYVCTNDAKTTAQAVTAAGGTVMMEPMDVMGQGWMGVFQDPTGAHFSVWQPENHRGAELVNEAGSFCWNELYTRDMPAARAFYEKVFGWGVEETEFSGGAYTLFKVGDKNIAGGLDMTSMLPEHVPPHWLVYFTVADAAASTEKAKELGGEVVSGPMDTPMGPMAVIRDPVGAVFAFIQASGES